MLDPYTQPSFSAGGDHQDRPGATLSYLWEGVARLGIAL